VLRDTRAGGRWSQVVRMSTLGLSGSGSLSSLVDVCEIKAFEFELVHASSMLCLHGLKKAGGKTSDASSSIVQIPCGKRKTRHAKRKTARRKLSNRPEKQPTGKVSPPPSLRTSSQCLPSLAQITCPRPSTTLLYLPRSIISTTDIRVALVYYTIAVCIYPQVHVVSRRRVGPLTLWRTQPHQVVTGLAPSARPSTTS